MALGFQQPDRVNGQAPLHAQFIGMQLMMDTHGLARLRRVHAVVDHVGDDLQHRRDDARAAGRAGDDVQFTVAKHHGRAHRGQGSLARLGRIGIAAAQSKGV